MSFLRVLIQLLLGAVAFFAVLFFVGRELWLYSAAYQLQRAAGQFNNIRQWQDAVNLCAGESGQTDAAFDGFQVRFLSDREYALEVHCLSAAPSVKSQANLPWGVKKTTGSAGLFYHFASRSVSGEFTLSFLGRNRVIAANGESVQNSWGVSTLRSDTPASVCKAHGFQCCDPVKTVGVGDPLSGGVTDCRGSCFQSCQTRPVLLYFQSDPGGDYESRVVKLYNSGGIVIFSALFDTTQSTIQGITIDYGDGTTGELPVPGGEVTKEYACPSGACTFTARILATDARGVVSADSRLSTWTIQVSAEPEPVSADTFETPVE